MREEEALKKEGMNVGREGGDLQARWFALTVITLLTMMALPPLGVSESTLKLSAMLVAMSGTLFLMAGLVFLQKTHYAGIMLIPAASLILLVSEAGSRMGAVVIGMVFCAAIAANILTCSCALNRLMGINSCPGQSATTGPQTTDFFR
jgi:hypothetical protein